VKRLLLYLPLVLGTAALAWSLFALAGVFTEERDEAVRALDDERDALTVHAHARLEESLRAHVAKRRGAFDRATAAPLVEAPGRLWRGGRQVRPLWSRPSVEEVPALPRVEARADGFFLRELTVALWAGKVPAAQLEDAVVRERLAAIDAMVRALDAKDRAALERAAGRWALHRERHLLAPWWEATSGLAGLAVLVNQEIAPLDGRFFEAAFFGEPGAARGGVVTHLLDPGTRERLPRRDLEGLLGLARSLAKDARVLPPRFDDVVKELLGHEERAPPFGAGLWIRRTEDGAEVGLRDEDSAIVTRVDLDTAVAALALPRAGATVRATPSAEWARQVSLVVDDAPFAAARDAAEARRQLKLGFLVAVAALWVAVALLSFLLLRRRQRFVELKDGFVSAVSHELRTPLASIRLQAETLERKLKDDPRARDYPARIVRDIDGLSFLVENLLSFSRLERGRITPSREPTRLDELIAQSREHVSRAVSEPMEWEVSGVSGVVLDVDPDLIRLCLDNLAKNGAQYNERKPVVLELKGRSTPDGFFLRVSDNGVGIAAEDQARVFEDFYRGRSEKVVRGSGLGLAICEAAMRAHGGGIRLVESGPQGTTFELRFPDAVAVG
jgi:signal transduction histidine kinase